MRSELDLMLQLLERARIAVVAVQQSLFPFLLAFSVFICCAEDEVHDENLIGDDEGDEENRLILGLAFEAVDEDEDEVGVVDDLCEENGLIEDQFWLLRLGIADERIVEVGQHYESSVDAAPRIGNVEWMLSLGRRMLAPKDVEE